MISASEFNEWLAYYTLEPWGSEVETRRFDALAASIAGFAATRRNPKFTPPSEILRRMRRPVSAGAQTMEDQKALLMALGGDTR